MSRRSILQVIENLKGSFGEQLKGVFFVGDNVSVDVTTTTSLGNVDSLVFGRGTAAGDVSRAVAARSRPNGQARRAG